MPAENIIARCPSCGTKNRVPLNRLGEEPVCGKCKTPLKTIIGAGRPVNVNDISFGMEVLNYPGTVLVDCWAAWCLPCKVLAPVMDELARIYRGRIKVAKLNADENPVISSKYSILSIPTLLIFKNGKLLDTMTGSLARPEIERRLAAYI